MVSAVQRMPFAVHELTLRDNRFCRQLSERARRTVRDVPRTPSQWHQDSNRDAIESDTSALVHTGTSARETR